jgi:hypothetical protein
MKDNKAIAIIVKELPNGKEKQLVLTKYMYDSMLDFFEMASPCLDLEKDNFKEEKGK